MATLLRAIFVCLLIETIILLPVSEEICDSDLELLQIFDTDLQNIRSDDLKYTLFNVGFMKLAMSTETYNRLKAATSTIKKWFANLDIENLDETLLLSHWQQDIFFGYTNRMDNPTQQQVQSFYFPKHFMYKKNIFPFINDTNVINIVQFMVKKTEEIFKEIWEKLDFFTKEHFETIVGANPTIHIAFNYYDSEMTGYTKNVSGLDLHSDFGFITLLFAEKNGLQILYDDKWYNIDVENDENKYFMINFGTLLDVTTNGKFKAGIHRVLNVEQGDRLSIGIFLDPNHDGYVYKYDEENDILVQDILYKKYIHKLFKQLYGKQDGVEV
eukprot:37877_1